MFKIEGLVFAFTSNVICIYEFAHSNRDLFVLVLKVWNFLYTKYSQFEADKLLYIYIFI